MAIPKKCPRFALQNIKAYTGPEHCTRSHCTRSYTALDRTALDRALFLILIVELQCVGDTISNAWLIHFSINYTPNLLP